MSTTLTKGERGATVPALPNETAAANPALIYLASLSSQNSRRAMRGCLERIVALLAPGTPIDAMRWHELRHGHVAAVRTALDAVGYAPATIALHLAALKGTLRAAWRMDLLDAEHLARACDVKPPRRSALPAGRHVDAGEVLALFDVVARDREPVGAARDAALLAILFGAGLRRSEITALDLEDFDAETGALQVRHGKGNKARIAYVSNGARQAVIDWIAVRGDEHGALLCPVTKAGTLAIRHLSTTAIADALQRLADRAGIAHASPHDARRTFIGELLEAGADLAHVQALVGHSSPTTTARYDRRPEAARQRAAERLHVPYRSRAG